MHPTLRIRDAHAALIASVGGEVDAIAPPGPADTIEIGRLGPLPCWSLAGTPALALSVARTLARRGRLGLVLADEPAGGRRTLVVAVAPIKAAVVSDTDPAALPLERLRRVASQPTRLGMALAVATALDVDAAGRRALRALRRLIDETVAHLDGRIRRDTRHAWVLLQVTRLLFLRFVEAEGWLDGDPAFLRGAVDRTLARRRDPATHLLHPLFFGTLNREPAHRSARTREFGTIPFLNGGLFEPHPMERAHQWRLPVAAWRELLDLLFGIEVSLDLGDVGDRVNPELLGRVFEGVMHPAERRDAGTFYTPSGLVPPLVRECYACHLAARLGREEERVHDALADPDRELAAAMVRLRVLDPAVGSGAFLVGALQLARGPGRQAHRRTRRLVARCLFGVDRNPAAVRLTELRLWLEVLRTMRGRPAARVAPLPNLDTTIRAGDALLDPLAGTGLRREFAARLAAARRLAMTSHGAARRRALDALRAGERTAMALALERNEERLHRALTELLEPARDTTLFGDPTGLSHRAAPQVRTLRRAIAAVRRERRRLDHDHGAPIFAVEAAFAPELADGGFDLVLGNPPWVRAERLPAAERRALGARYRWWRGSGVGWQHLPDLSVAFVERAIDLLAPGGTVGFLLPAKLATARYAATCRAAMAHRTTLHLAADLSSDPRADFEATTYPLALVASRRPPAASQRVRIVLHPGTEAVAQQAWRDRGTWPLGGSQLLDLATTLASRHPSLGERWTPALGVKTGANEVFLDPPRELAPWTRPVLRGRDLARGSAIARHRILWPADARGNPLPELPAPVAAHLAAHRRRLERRSDWRDGPWWQLFRTGPATARWRVAWADLARDLRPAALSDPSLVPLNSCYVIPCRDRDEMLLLAAWLRSSPIATLARLDAEPAANGYARFGSRAVAGVPFPDAACRDPLLRDLAVAGSPQSAALDARVATLLGLDERQSRLFNAIATPGR